MFPPRSFPVTRNNFHRILCDTTAYKNYSWKAWNSVQLVLDSFPDQRPSIKNSEPLIYFSLHRIWTNSERQGLCVYWLVTIYTQNYWLFGLCLSSGIIKARKQRFGNWICFRPQVRGETLSLLGPLERANLNHWTSDWGWFLCFLVCSIRHDGRSPKPQ
jgi:hypothetical protein